MDEAPLRASSALGFGLEFGQGFHRSAVNLEQFVQARDLEYFVNLRCDVSHPKIAVQLVHLPVEVYEHAQGCTGEMLDVLEAEEHLDALFASEELGQFLADVGDGEFLKDFLDGKMNDPYVAGVLDGYVGLFFSHAQTFLSGKPQLWNLERISLG